MPLLLQPFPTPCAQFGLLFATFFYAGRNVCVTAVFRDHYGGGGGGGGGCICVSVRVQDGHSSPPRTHSPVITAALQILHICNALHCLAPFLPSPHHLCLPPTSPLPHQDHPNISPRCFLKLPWVTGPHAQIMLACRGGAGQRGRE